jgi:hypothetical protein
MLWVIRLASFGIGRGERLHPNAGAASTDRITLSFLLYQTWYYFQYAACGCGRPRPSLGWSHYRDTCLEMMYDWKSQAKQ